MNIKYIFCSIALALSAGNKLQATDLVIPPIITDNDDSSQTIFDVD
ncbi:hypothetical protein ACFLY6_03470 [Candidatus Dependentiae bacterium]